MKTFLVATVAVLYVALALVWAESSPQSSGTPGNGTNTTTEKSTAGNSPAGNSPAGNTTLNSATGGSNTTGTSSAITPEVETAICSNKDLEAGDFCKTKGAADTGCKSAATKANGTDPDCWDIGVCCITIGGGASSNATTTATPANGTTAAGGQKILITTLPQVANFTQVKNCTDKVHILVAAK